jgi:hypothetical protein
MLSEIIGWSLVLLVAGLASGIVWFFSEGSDHPRAG